MNTKIQIRMRNPIFSQKGQHWKNLPKKNIFMYLSVYAQTLIVMVLIVVNFGGFLVIARNPRNEF